jgi:hypothetical protein
MLDTMELTKRDIPTEEQWDFYEQLFRNNKSGLSLVKKLRANGNAPLLVKENPEIDRGRLGGMNAQMTRKNFVHRFRSQHPKYFDNICLKYEISHKDFEKAPDQ